MNQVIAGPMAVCLRHWVEAVGDLDRAIDTLRKWGKTPVAQYEAVHAWCTNGPLPEGERLIRLQVFLAVHGYTVEEHEKLPVDIQAARMAIGLAHITVKDLTKRLGYQKENQTRNILLGKSKPIGPFKSKFDAFVRELATQKESGPVVVHGAGQTVAGVRKLVEHVVTLFNSSAGLITVSNIKPSDVLDGDRMNIQSAMQRMCQAVGINASFNSTAGHGVPVTKNDLQLSTSRRRT